jgi:RNA polymerase sigma factor (sigma-70 family)
MTEVAFAETSEGTYLRPMELGAARLSTALEACIARFRGLVRTIGRQRGLAEADLDEVLQEVRIRLWRAGQAGKELDELGSSYVYRVAMTAAIDVIRRRRARSFESADVTEPVEVAARAPGPLAEVEASELAQRVDAAIELLPLARRTPVRMYLTGYEREEIAHFLGWTEGKTRNLLYRGLDDLRRHLTAQGITGGGTR